MVRALRGQSRLLFVLASLIVLFISGSPYYFTLFPVRVFTHVLFTLVLGGWLIARLLKGGGLPRTPFDVLVVALLAWWAITTASSLDPRISAETLWFPLCHILMFYFMADWIQRGCTRLLIETQFLMAAVVVILAGLQFASWLFGLGIVPGTEVGWLRVAGEAGLKLPALYLPLGVTTWLAGYTAPLVLLSAGWALTTPRRDYRAVLWLLVGALVLVLVLTNSRGGLLAFGVSVGAFGVLRLVGDRQFGQRWRRIALLAGAVLALGLLIFLITSSRGGVRVASDTLRLSLWNAAGDIIGQYPITGVGPGEFGRGYRMLRPPAAYDDRLGTAHNVILNTFAETGMFGVLIGLAFVGVVIVQWWRHWRGAEGGRKVRLAAAFAALIGFGVQNMVDLFLSTPLVLLMLLLVAYCVIAPGVRRSQSDTRAPLGSRALAGGVLALLALYAAAFFTWDQAHSAFNRSLREDENALDAIEQAIALDPSLRLYRLQRAYLIGLGAGQSEQAAAEALAAYEDAVRLEPTWDTGYLNLAALYLRQGDSTRALDSLAVVRDLNYASPGAFQWARVGEIAGVPIDEIRRNDDIALTGTLPLSPYWWQTDVRRAAAEAVLDAQPIDVQYRVLIDADPPRAAALVPDVPQTAAEWWIVGDAAYRAGDMPRAVGAFTQAIARRGTGDDYASRARAQREIDVAATRRDLDIAAFLGPGYENVAAAAARLEADPEIQIARLQRSVGTRVISQNFEGVLFLGRSASFQPYAEMQFDNVNRTQLTPVFTLAGLYEQRGDTQGAMRLYHYILVRLPDDAEAQTALARLGAGQ